ncbi:hypothetical protein CAI21_00975 [Alkalilimnicola ehrlichii]|uniref:hypothetical protein n=1 Tax=Alkalilimnicola ehrlichii TaxID=351052 RepID=UPI000E2ED6B9|nr:hypothetical protein [Alkalilimnicola ehrlichii]RFA31245.1 hypothetical protein CAI21_00975 [Alkalilimnicola ehrlichii]
MSIQPHPSLVQRLGSVLWPSFLSAGVAAGIFFANIDPETLRAATVPSWEISRMAGYAVGFFMFWGATAFSSALTLLLLQKPAPADAAPPDNDRNAA